MSRAVKPLHGEQSVEDDCGALRPLYWKQNADDAGDAPLLRSSQAHPWETE